jgi:ribosomal protein L9
MLIVEILNYYQTNYLLLRKLSKSYNNHEIIEKFFVEQEKKTKKKIL